MINILLLLFLQYSLISSSAGSLHPKINTRSEQSSSEDTSKSAEVVVYGALSGACARTATAPFDFLKVRLQLAPLNSNPEYRSLRSALRTVLREEGVRAFWRGNVAGIWLYSIYGAVQFSIYDRLKEANVSPLWAGAISSMGATFISYPIDLIRTRHTLQNDQKYYRGVFGTSIKICKTEGIGGLYRGIIPSLGQVVPYMGISFYAYEKSRKILIEKCSFNDSSSVDLMAGMVSGGMAKTIMMPIDNVRRRLQIQGSNYDAYVFRGLPKYKGFVHCVVHVVQHEGVRGFYKGSSVALMKAITNSAITFLFFGASKR